MTRRRWILLLGALLVVGLAGAGFLEHFRLKRAVQRHWRELAAKGEKLSMQEPVRQQDRDALAAGADLMDAMGRVSGIGIISPGIMRSIGPGRAQVAWKQDPLLDQDQTNLWPQLVETLDRQRDALEATGAVLAENDRFRFAIDYASYSNLRLPHLAPLKRLTQTLCAAAILDLHNGNAERAWTSVLAGARLNHKLEIEPLMISHLVRMAMHALLWGATWEALQHSDWSDAQLEEAQRLWMETDWIDGIDTLFRRERAFTATALDRMRQSQAEWTSAISIVGTMFGATGGGNTLDEFVEQPVKVAHEFAQQHLGYWPWRWWDSYADELFCQRVWGEGIEAQKRLVQKRSLVEVRNELQEALGEIRSDHQPSWTLTRCGVPDEWVGTFLAKSVTAQTQRELMVAGIALHRYRLRHDRWPTNLVQLVPGILPELPRDYVDGQPLRYRLLEDGGFLLYSVGADGKDDGGDGTPIKGRHVFGGRDWVWPEPASAEEIQAHWKEHGKKR